MSAIFRLLRILAGAAGLIGLVACVGGVIGCWSLHGELCQQLDRVFARVDGSLSEIGGDILRAHDGLLQARQDLAAIRRDKAESAPGPSNERGGRPSLAGKAMTAIGHRLDAVKPQIVRAVEVGRMVNGLLEALSDFWLVEQAGIDTDRLNEAAQELSALIGKVQKLATLIDGPTDAGAAEEPSRLSESVDRIVAILDQSADRAQTARERMAGRQDRIERFVTTIAWISTAVLAWIGLGQLSLLVHSRAMVRRSRRTTAITSNSNTPASSGSR
jgi:hypothetical protein